jgi:hypothetical protein
MAGGGDSGTSRVINETKVDPVTQQWRNNVMNRGNAIMNQGAPAYYPGNTVVPFANQTQQGLNSLEQHAQQGAPNLGAANNSASRALSGFNPAQGAAMGAAFGGLNNQQTGGLQQFGGGTNPALDSLWNQGAEKITNAVNGNMMQAGRFGANAAHTGALTQGLGDLWGQVYAPAYEAERNRGLQAATTMAGVGADDRNRQLQGIDLSGALWSQGNQDAARQQALLPSLFSYGQQPGQAMLDIGGMYEGQAQNYMNEDRARYDYNANAPRDTLSWYSGLMSGLPDFSQTTQTTQGPGTNRTMSGLGGAMAGAQMGSMFGPWGTAIGGGLGALGGLFG